jgi:UDP-N-acetylmuramyl tripeptide synthase
VIKGIAAARYHRWVSLRAQLAPPAGRALAWLSRAVGRGEGEVIGGKAALMLDAGLPGRLAAPMQVALVSGTNGKTTTTTLLAAGFGAWGPVCTNRTGANLATGLTSALLATPHAARAALEVDEAVLPWALRDLRPAAVVLLNLSRDQLDRYQEVRGTARRWRDALEATPPDHVVANADDPLVVYAVGDAPARWVSAGLAWSLDASACPWCGADITFGEDGWRCPGCGRHRPACAFALTPTAAGGHGTDGIDAVGADGRLVRLGLSLPGRSARANALMAYAVIDALGLDADAATARWGSIASIEGRYQRVAVDGTDVVLYLAKNPAGWADLLDLVRDGKGPLILGLNARGQDGRDPSWIWDVPFEVLAGRRGVCIGERAADLAVRLDYAGVDVTVAPTVRRAVASIDPPTERDGQVVVELIANYSAFQQARAELRERA